MDFAVLIKALLVIISVMVGLYLLSLIPKSSEGINYAKIMNSIKRNPFKLIAGLLLLYSLYITLLYNNSKKDSSRYDDQYYLTLEQLDSCQKENSDLREKINSLTQAGENQ